MARDGILNTVQAGRGLTALLILLYHTNTFFGPGKAFERLSFGAMFNFTDSSVDFFFVISGFIITYVHQHDIGHKEKVIGYARKRFCRVFPTFWVVYAVAVVGAIVIPSSRHLLPTQPWRLILAAALIPQDPRYVGMTGVPILSVAWTLCHEMLFYSMFILLLASRGLGIAAFGLWMLGIILFYRPDAYPINFLFSPHNFQFVCGMLTFAICQRHQFASPQRLASVALVTYIVAALALDQWGVTDKRVSAPIFGLCGAVMLTGLVQAEQRGLIGVSNFLTRVGEASYSLYLIHYPVLSLLAKLVTAFGLYNRISLQLVFALMVSMTIATGFICYRLVETPLIGLTRRRM